MEELKLKTPDGKSVDIEAAELTFAAAMAQPETDVPAPPKMTAEEKEQIKAEAPKRTRGRPGKAERARTTAAPAQKTDKDFSEEISGITTGIWLTTASIPYTQAFAPVIKLNQPALVAQLNQAAQNNSQVRGYVEKLGSGGGGLWVLGLGVTCANMAMQTVQIMKDPELRRQMAEQTRQDLQDFLTANGLGQVQDGTDKNQ